MKIKHLCFVLLSVALLSFMASPAMACRCRKPGRSPGWWKHQINAYREGKGNPHVSLTMLEGWAEEIDERWGNTPWFFGYPLPPVADLDYDEDGEFTIDDAYGIFNDTEWNHMWTHLANWFNWAAGRRPYWG